jgi:Uma2 family endonuclease
MADPALNIPRISAKEYLQNELHNTCKHEFVDGIVYMMAGASRQHNLISGDVFTSLMNRVSSPCFVYSSDMKVHVKASTSERFYYPDTHVTCSDLDNDQQYNMMPVLVVEVASDSTEGYDRQEKFEGYRLLPSLQEYVLVQQSKPLVEIFRKRTAWAPETFGPGDDITLESIGLNLPVAEFYRRVIF